MVIDDEPPITRMLRAILERALDAEVLEFNAAEEAMEHYRAHTADVDLVICDLRMPKVSGMQLCRELREADRELPIVVLTAYASDDVESAARELDVNEFVQKPFLPKPFIALVRRLLKLPEDGTA